MLHFNKCRSYFREVSTFCISYTELPYGIYGKKKELFANSVFSL